MSHSHRENTNWSNQSFFHLCRGFSSCIIPLQNNLCQSFLWLSIHFQFSYCFTHAICKIGVERTIKISQIAMKLRKISALSIIRLILKKTHVFIFQKSFYFAQKKRRKIVAFKNRNAFPGLNKISWSLSISLFKCFSNILLTSFLIHLTKRWNQS